MSAIEDAEGFPENGDDNKGHSSSDIPKSKIKGVLEEFEMYALQHGNQNLLDIAKFSDAQKDKLLEILSVNEKNAFEYHSKRIEAIRDIEVKKIDASIVNQKTLRILIVSAVVLLPLITLIILFFKESYFIPWLTFLTGLMGGVGISRMISRFYQQLSDKNPIENNSDN